MNNPSLDAIAIDAGLTRHLIDPTVEPYVKQVWATPGAVAKNIEAELNAEPEHVNHPSHYGGDTVYEAIKVAEAWGLDKDAYLFNVLKYIARAGKKGSQLEDLKKGRFYIDRRIGLLESENGG